MFAYFYYIGGRDVRHEAEPTYQSAQPTFNPTPATGSSAIPVPAPAPAQSPSILKLIESCIPGKSNDNSVENKIDGYLIGRKLFDEEAIGYGTLFSALIGSLTCASLMYVSISFKF